MKILSILSVAFLLLFYSCTQEVKLKAAQVNTKSTIQLKTDTLAEEAYCNLAINGKKFSISEDDIAVDYNVTDSSLNITFNKIETGFITFHIPNMFKCPCTVPTGYSPISTKVSFTEVKILLPTIVLQNYPLQGISFQNLNDGFNPKKIEDGAATIFMLQPNGEGSSSTGYKYLIKGKIHTTALKSVYESNAGEKNKDYRIEGSFVIKKRIYTQVT